MKLAITGGTGFVGSHLVDAALAGGHEVKALTRRDRRCAKGSNGFRAASRTASRSSAWSAMPTQ